MAAAHAGWSLERGDATCLIRCRDLDRVVGVAHAFSTRTNGDPALLLAASGIVARELYLLEQVHGATLVDVRAAGASAPRADGALARRGDVRAPAVRTADCVPLLLADVDGRAVAAVHAGWRGTAAGIATAAVRHLRSVGIAPRALRAALGPAIGPCCYEVGVEVAEAVARASAVRPAEISTGAGPKRRLDLHAANRFQLLAVGLTPAAIACAPWCTACTEELFFSYRRDGAGGGRHLACIGWSHREPGDP